MIEPIEVSSLVLKVVQLVDVFQIKIFPKDCSKEVFIQLLSLYWNDIVELKWSNNAQRLVGAGPQPADVRLHVENYAKDKKLRDIRVSSVYDSKPGKAKDIRE